MAPISPMVSVIPITPTSNNELLSVKNLDLVFGEKPESAFQYLDQNKSRDDIRSETGNVVAVHGVSFSVFKNEILVFMGLSGSGKSSLLRCLNGMNGRPVSAFEERDNGRARGSITFRNSKSGRDLDVLRCTSDDLRNLHRHHIAMVFQQSGLMPWRTVWENVAFPLQLRKVPKSEVNQAVQEKLELVGLASWGNRYPHELSGGMRQRVGLARAFVTQADILLMDEPFSALDLYHRKKLQEEVLTLQKGLNKTIVFVTHDPREAFAIADRIAILDSGKILQLDAAEKVRLSPAGESVTRIISESHVDGGSREVSESHNEPKKE